MCVKTNASLYVMTSVGAGAMSLATLERAYFVVMRSEELHNRLQLL